MCAPLSMLQLSFPARELLEFLPAYHWWRPQRMPQPPRVSQSVIEQAARSTQLNLPLNEAVSC